MKTIEFILDQIQRILSELENTKLDSDLYDKFSTIEYLIISSDLDNKVILLSDRDFKNSKKVLQKYILFKENFERVQGIINFYHSKPNFLKSKTFVNKQIQVDVSLPLYNSKKYCLEIVTILSIIKTELSVDDSFLKNEENNAPKVSSSSYEESNMTSNEENFPLPKADQFRDVLSNFSNISDQAKIAEMKNDKLEYIIDFSKDILIQDQSNSIEVKSINDETNSFLEFMRMTHLIDKT